MPIRDVWAFVRMAERRGPCLQNRYTSVRIRFRTPIIEGLSQGVTPGSEPGPGRFDSCALSQSAVYLERSHSGLVAPLGKRMVG